MNFANYLDMSAAEAPDDLAVTDPQRDLTYRELAGETDAFANALAELGVDPGDRVALYLPNSTAFVAADRKSTRLNSSHITRSRMPSSA